MYCNDEQCLNCGARARPSLNLSNVSSLYSLGEDGQFSDTPLWFCSVECYKKLVGKYLDPEFHFDVSMDDHPVFAQQKSDWILEYDAKGMSWYNRERYASQTKCIGPKIEQLKDTWSNVKQTAIRNAEEELLRRVYAEVAHEVDEEEQRLREQMRKISLQQQREQERMGEQERKEQERLEDRRQRDEERRKREQERLEEKRERDEEKRRKEEAERAAREAEEEKWEPQDFGNI